MSEKAFQIFLVRHGEPAAHWGEERDPGLSERGREQASVASEHILELLDGGTRIVSSPLLRARQTAEPLATALDADIEIDAAFREIPAPTDLTGRPEWIKEFMQQTWETQPDFLLAWRARACEQLFRLHSCTVVFTHFMVLNAIVGRLEDRKETVCFLPDNASITQLQRAGDTLEVVQLGHQMPTVIN
ncbi:MAG: histidine phosphatase family protein [Woeseiaceae bacterium]|jgi:broad specificity phosphatase PhoE